MNRPKKITLAGVVTAALVAVTAPATAYASSSAPAAPAAHHAAGARAAGAQASTPVTQLIGSGTMNDGASWSVSLVYYAHVPAAYVAQNGPVPAGDSLLCQRVVIAGTQVDAQAGAWADCQPVDDSAAPQSDEGLWGNTEKGTSGDRVFVARPPASVTRAVMSLADSDQRTAQVVGVPGTAYRAYAIPVSGGETIASVDEYDAAGQLVDQQTDWR
ncbi:hypothetical protein [Streptantibioticus silvisoli]|uniref:Secreted protein n=1 Tax=Streptantibioticus silvisoli TaxID=2705255 RepID=A0ABT6WAB8_9ACTN|nr:hypothetical protein [Streptantibioticus silvisoli]MDI5967262.1 hypothetical protein [Streptantibioticus silvisoli]